MSITTLNFESIRHEQWDFYKSEEEGNTGFFYSRSNEQTIKLWTDTLQLAPR